MSISPCFDCTVIFAGGKYVEGQRYVADSRKCADYLNVQNPTLAYAQNT